MKNNLSNHRNTSKNSFHNFLWAPPSFLYGNFFKGRFFITGVSYLLYLRYIVRFFFLVFIQSYRDDEAVDLVFLAFWPPDEPSTLAGLGNLPADHLIQRMAINLWHRGYTIDQIKLCTTDIDKDTVSSLRFIHVLRCEFYHIWIQMKIRYDDQTVSRLGRFPFNYVFFMSDQEP